MQWPKERATDVEEWFLSVMEIPVIVGDIDVELCCKALDELEGVVTIDPKVTEYAALCRLLALPCRSPDGSCSAAFGGSSAVR
jgi:hypothetical protein